MALGHCGAPREGGFGHGEEGWGYGDVPRVVARTPVPSGQRQEAHGHGYDVERRRPEPPSMANGDGGHGEGYRTGQNGEELTPNRAEETAGSEEVRRRRIWKSPVRRPAVISRSRRRLRGFRERFLSHEEEHEHGEHEGHEGAAGGGRWPRVRAHGGDGELRGGDLDGVREGESVQEERKGCEGGGVRLRGTREREGEV